MLRRVLQRRAASLAVRRTAALRSALASSSLARRAASTAANGNGNGNSNGRGASFALPRALNYRFGLVGADALLDAYRHHAATACNTPAARDAAAAAQASAGDLAALQAALSTEAHAFELRAYVNKKFTPSAANNGTGSGNSHSEAASASASASDPDATRKNRAYAVLCSYLTPLYADTQSLNDNVLSERFRKTLRLALPAPLGVLLRAPDPRAVPFGSDYRACVELDVAWRVERQKVLGHARGGLTIYDAALAVTPVSPAVRVGLADDGADRAALNAVCLVPEQTGEPGTDERVPLPLMRDETGDTTQPLLTMTDCTYELNETAWNDLYARLITGPSTAAKAAPAPLTPAEFAWFVAWAASHPSDDF